MNRLIILILIEVVAISLFWETFSYLMTMPPIDFNLAAALVGFYLAMVALFFATLAIVHQINRMRSGLG